MSPITRRAWLKQLSAFSALGAAGPLGLGLSAIERASASSSGDDYKALVCIFMYGGNDAFNMVLATDADTWPHYQHHRDPSLRQVDAGGSSLAFLPSGTPPNPQAAACSPARLGGVLPIGHSGRAAHAGRSFALNPLMGGCQQLYQQGRLAVLANVGPLLAPLSKAQYLDEAHPRPAKLYSHNDQQSTWQAMAPEGATEGWGGRMADLLMSRNALPQTLASPLLQRSFTCLSPTSQTLWLSGQQVQPLVVNTTSVPTLGSWDTVLGQPQVRNLLASVMGASGGSNLLAQDHQAVVQRALAAEAVISQALAPLGASDGSAPWASPGQGNPWIDPLLYYTSPVSGQPQLSGLAMQLQMVARLIDTNRRGRLGMRRQVFFVAHHGFDHHDAQQREHADRMAQLDHALAYFDDVLARMPGGDLRHQVTSFTASEFGRSLTNNSDGTDHGWGAHHLIMGGAVRGGEVYGSFPRLATADAQGQFDSPDLVHNGILLPSTSVEQLAYTLGRWMGAPDTELRDILPRLAGFDATTHNLGFMG
jgi:uncharacterized protein (DUF1501 family)